MMHFCGFLNGWNPGLMAGLVDCWAAALCSQLPHPARAASKAPFQGSRPSPPALASAPGPSGVKSTTSASA